MWLIVKIVVSLIGFHELTCDELNKYNLSDRSFA